MINKRLSVWISIILSQGVFVALIPIWKNLFDYLHPIVLFVVWFCITILGFYIVFLCTKNTIYLSKITMSVLIFLYSVCLLILLFIRPSNQNYSNFNLIPFKTILFYLDGGMSFFISFYNLSANVLLFVPYGISIMFFRKGKITKIKKNGIPILSIAFIEILQFITKRGTMDVDDVLLNFLGIYIGYWIFPLIHKVLKLK